MDYSFKVSGIMNVDTDKHKIINQDDEGIWEWESDDKVYSLTLGMVVFDKNTNSFSYVTNDDKLREMGFNVYDYDNINWESDPSQN
jgi:hypothetical protein